MRWTSAAAAVILLAVASAHAEGSLGLDEVITAVAKSPKLVAEIQAELVKNNLKANGVTCIAARHGNHWTYLGGGRAAPYECEIGKRTIRIEADRVYFDERGRLLGDLDKADPKHAKTFREDNFRWAWTP
jgi:predicted pyridoxine 5'-phosphate oxidase superfamily flavin-nucleotide-binding protein